jgi:hypothetical protein
MAMSLLERGWKKFPPRPDIVRWAAHARTLADAIVSDPANAKWLRCGGTWFAGVNALPNGPDGALAGGPALAGPAIDFVRSRLRAEPAAWDKGQLSVCYSGYPQKTPGEPLSAFEYRMKRCAAHVDGLLAVGAEKRRFPREYHAFILGIPLDTVEEGGSPLVVWEGSHAIVKRALGDQLGPHPPERWHEIDVTEAYHAARREAFDQCRPVALTANAGETYLLHRLALHGVAPWANSASSPGERRAIAYFRPSFADRRDWLFAA